MERDLETALSEFFSGRVYYYKTQIPNGRAVGEMAPIPHHSREWVMRRAIQDTWQNISPLRNLWRQQGKK